MPTPKNRTPEQIRRWKEIVGPDQLVYCHSGEHCENPNLDWEDMKHMMSDWEDWKGIGFAGDDFTLNSRSPTGWKSHCDHCLHRLESARLTDRNIDQLNGLKVKPARPRYSLKAPNKHDAYINYRQNCGWPVEEAKIQFMAGKAVPDIKLFYTQDVYYANVDKKKGDPVLRGTIDRCIARFGWRETRRSARAAITLQSDEAAASAAVKIEEARQSGYYDGRTTEQHMGPANESAEVVGELRATVKRLNEKANELLDENPKDAAFLLKAAIDCESKLRGLNRLPRNAMDSAPPEETAAPSESDDTAELERIRQANESSRLSTGGGGLSVVDSA